jgi:hypothetical protein
MPSVCSAPACRRAAEYERRHLQGSCGVLRLRRTRPKPSPMGQSGTHDMDGRHCSRLGAQGPQLRESVGYVPSSLWQQHHRPALATRASSGLRSFKPRGAPRASRCSRMAPAPRPNPSVNATPTSCAPGPRGRPALSSASRPWLSAGGRALPQTLGRMFTVLSDFLDLLLVLGTSVWGWIGVVGGLGAAFLAWSVVEPQPARGAASAIAFVVTFMLFAWQELGKHKK